MIRRLLLARGNDLLVIGTGQQNLEYADRARNVLDLSFAQIVVAAIDSVVHIVVGVGRNQYAARFGQLFQSSRYIDVVTVDIVLLNDYVADVNSDTEQETLLRRKWHYFSHDRFLELERTANRFHGARKLCKEAVACRLDDPPRMAADRGHNEG